MTAQNSSDTTSAAKQPTLRELELRLAAAKAEAKAARMEAEALALQADLEQAQNSAAPTGQAEPVAATAPPTMADRKAANPAKTAKSPGVPQRGEQRVKSAKAPDAKTPSPKAAVSKAAKPSKKEPRAEPARKSTSAAASSPAPKLPPQPAVGLSGSEKLASAPKPPAAPPAKETPHTKPSNKNAATKQEKLPQAAAKSLRRKPETKAPPAAPPKQKTKLKSPPVDETPRVLPPVVNRPPAEQPATRPARIDDSFERPRPFLRGVPSWFVSTAVHMILFVVLALWTFGEKEEPEELLVTALPTDRIDDIQDLEPIEFQTELEQLDEMSVDPMQVDAMAVANLGDIMAADTAALSDVAMLQADSSFDSIGNLFGADGIGMNELGAGKGAAMFFGVKTTGNRFAFVVDNSNSMNNGKFETAVYELIRSVQQLDKTQYFYVVFYSDTAYPLLYPESVENFVPATDENKRKLEYWLMSVHRCLRTNGEEAMSKALSLRPDVIYLLGDGAFGDKTVEKTLQIQNDHVTIHTLGFKMKEKDASGFVQIAEKFKGKFTDVAVTPAMVQVSQRMKRPKNNTRNGVWGIKLPAQK